MQPQPEQVAEMLGQEEDSAPKIPIKMEESDKEEPETKASKYERFRTSKKKQLRKFSGQV